MTITEPSQYSDKDPSQSAWEKQVTEATNRIQHQIDNINESVNTPQSLVAVYSKTQDGAVQQFTPFADGDGFVAYVAYTDSLPTLPVTGATFSAYSDEEIDVIIKQYRETATRPPNPGTTSYQVSGGVWSESTNWTKTKLNRAGVNVWFCEAKIKGQAGQTVTAKWSNPKLLYGGAVANGILYYNAAATDANKPSAPTATGYDYDSGIFTGLTSGWQYVPITTAMGGGSTISHKHWQVTFHVETSEVTNGQIITFGTVEGFIPIGSVLQSDNYSGSGSLAGWKIERTGDADFNNVNIRGNSTVQGSVIVDGTVSADAIAATTLSAITADLGTIDAGTINGGTINAGQVTVSGGFTAPQLNVGVIIRVYQANFNLGTNVGGTFNTSNSVDTDLIITSTAKAKQGGAGTGVSGDITGKIVVAGAVTSLAGAVIGGSSGIGSDVSATTHKVTGYSQNSTVTFNGAGSSNGAACSASVMVLEVKRT